MISQAPPRRFGQQDRLALNGLLFVLPSLVLFIAFVAGPVIYALYLSFNDWTMMRSPVWRGLDNYGAIFRDEVFRLSVRNTAVYTLLYVPSITLLALLAATAANRPLLGRSVLKALIFIPAITPSIVVGAVWKYIYNGSPDVGILNALLQMVGHDPIIWLGDKETALPALVAASVWQRFGWFMILFLAGLQDVPTEVKEAAAIDGASPVRSFFGITLPLLRPTFALVTVLAVIGSFQVFDLVFAMTGGGPAYATHTLSYYIYLRAFQSQDMGYAAAMSYVLFLAVFALTLFQLKVLRPAADH